MRKMEFYEICAKCGQKDQGQTGEYPCQVCGLPLLHDNHEKRPQDDTLDGAGWTYKNVEHGGKYPDTMPQAIIATDAAGISHTYIARAAIFGTKEVVQR